MRLTILGTLAFCAFMSWHLRDHFAPEVTATPAAEEEHSTTAELSPRQEAHTQVTVAPLTAEASFASTSTTSPSPELASTEPDLETGLTLTPDIDEIIDLEVIGASELDVLVEAFDPQRREATREALAELLALEATI